MTSTITTTYAQVTDELIESMAAEAQAHRRTIERRLLGLSIKGHALARRVDEVLLRRGLARCRSIPASPPQAV
jgi:hypothetical protein